MEAITFPFSYRLVADLLLRRM